jgi:tetratricopeptide (TPR) repeat protein
VNMGTCLVKMERYEEARDLYQKSLEINQKCLGEDYTSTANSKWGLADVLNCLGEPQRAL